jgi:hypothetical protein
MAEASGRRTDKDRKDIDNKGNPLESIALSDQKFNIRWGLQHHVALIRDR